MSIWIPFRDAFLSLLRLLPIKIPLTFLDFAFGFGSENDGSIGRRPSLLLLFVCLVVFRSLCGSSTYMMVGMGILLLVTC